MMYPTDATKGSGNTAPVAVPHIVYAVYRQTLGSLEHVVVGVKDEQIARAEFCRCERRIRKGHVHIQDSYAGSRASAS
jgi:hypothetical protein